MLLSGVISMTLSSEISAQKPQKPIKAGEKKQAMLVYTCPMHAEVVENKPGSCPKCGMRLVEIDKSKNIENRAKDSTHIRFHQRDSSKMKEKMMIDTTSAKK